MSPGNDWIIEAAKLVAEERQKTSDPNSVAARTLFSLMGEEREFLREVSSATSIPVYILVALVRGEKQFTQKEAELIAEFFDVDAQLFLGEG